MSSSSDLSESVTSRLPCMLWRASLRTPPDFRSNPRELLDSALWDFRILDTTAAQRLLPLELRPGEDYSAAWGRSLHPDDVEPVRDSAALALVAGVPYFDRDFRCADRHGRLHWLHEEVTVEAHGPDQWRMFGVVTDITARKLADLALRESEARYDLAARAGRVGIWDWDVVTGQIFLSENLKAILGYPPDYPLEDAATWQATLHPEDAARVREATAANHERDVPYELEVRRRHRDGTYRWFLSRGTTARDPAGGRPLRMTGTLTDITDRRRAEEALRASEAQYRDAAETNRRLLLELDHRLRNQLAGLSSLVALMRDRARDVGEFAGAIDARLLAMSHVHHLLSAGEWKDVDMEELISSLLARARPLAPYPTGVGVSGPSVRVPAHLALPLAMIVSELVTNSIKHGAHSVPGGRVTVAWDLSGPEAPSGRPRVTVRWVESGGPAPPADPAPSLGTSLIRSFATRELGGTCSLTYPPAGAAHTLSFPLPS